MSPPLLQGLQSPRLRSQGVGLTPLQVETSVAVQWASARCTFVGVRHSVMTCNCCAPPLIVLLQVKESMAEGQPGHTSKAQSVSTGARWFQSKRVPLYFMVGAGEAARCLEACLEDMWRCALLEMGPGENLEGERAGLQGVPAGIAHANEEPLYTWRSAFPCDCGSCDSEPPRAVMIGQELPLHASASPVHVATTSCLLPGRVQVQSAVGSSASAAAMTGLPVLPHSTGQDCRLPILAASAASQQSSVLL